VRATALEEQDTEAVAAPNRWQRLPLLRPLSLRDFRLIWVGETISLLGDQFYFVALTWLTLQLTGSGLALGTLLMAAAIPRAALMLAGGAITDRFSPRFLMLASNLLRGILVAIVAGLLLLNAVQLWELYVLAVIFGAVDAVFYPASNTILPMLLDEPRLRAGTALMQGTLQGTTLIGPALAGILIATVGSVSGTGAAFAFDAASFAVASLALWLIRGGMRAPTGISSADAPSRPASTGLLADIGAGLRYAWDDPVIRSLLFVIAAVDFSFAGPFGVGLASLAHTRFVGGAAAFGTMISGWGAGALIGTIIGGSLSRVRRRGITTLLLVAVMGCGLAFIGFAPSVVLATVLVAAIGIGSGFVNVIMVPWLQTRTDAAMLGRVMSLIMFASVGLAPLSYAVSGALVSFNLTLLFAVAGAVVVASAALAFSNRPMRTID
jgi:Major Facilitator Superfamily